MTRDDIVRMARACDIEPDTYAGWLDVREVERFAALIAEHERQAVVELANDPYHWDDSERLIEAIKKRGQA